MKNNIFIIESLGTNDTKTAQKLYHSLKLISFNTSSFIECLEIDSICTKNEFIIVIEKIEKISSNSQELNFTIIHLECHGSEEGVFFSDGNYISWEEFMNYMRRVNIILKNQLILSLPICYGISIFAFLDIEQESPFHMIILPKGKIISQQTIISFFEDFYNTVFYEIDEKKSFNKIKSSQFMIMEAEAIFDCFLGNISKNNSHFINELAIKMKEYNPDMTFEDAIKKAEYDMSKLKKSKEKFLMRK